MACSTGKVPLAVGGCFIRYFLTPNVALKGDTRVGAAHNVICMPSVDDMHLEAIACCTAMRIDP